jgi:AcrR family transcriptional regulator
MRSVVGRQGYPQTTVADVIAVAGVSRKAFYEQFANREECFLETYDTISAGGLDRVASAFRPDRTPSLSTAVAAGLGALCEQAIEQPLDFRVMLVEIGALGAAGAARRERMMGAYEQLLRESLSLPRGSGAIPNPVLRAIVGGISHVVDARVRAGRERQLRKLVPELVRWIDSYHPVPAVIPALRDPSEQVRGSRGSLTGGRAPGSLWPPVSPSRKRGLRGESVGSRSFVVHSQRERVLDAVATLSESKGYTAVTVKDIAGQAAVSLDAFYEHFAGKEDAFLVAYEIGHGKSLAAVERACDSAPDWRSAARDAIAALFEFLACEPAFAHLALVDARVATARIAERANRGMGAYARMLQLLRQAASSDSPLEPVAVEAILGGVFELCLSCTLQQRVETLPQLLPLATYFVLAPFVGAEDAAALAVTEPFA